jgi:hypothetical protein
VVVEAALSLREAGDVSPAMESENGLHVLAVTERPPMSTRPLGELGAEIPALILDDRRDALPAGLLDKLKVRVFEERLSTGRPAESSEVFSPDERRSWWLVEPGPCSWLDSLN